MKKVLALFVSIMLLGALTACGTKRVAPGVEDFSRVLEENGFTVQDVTEDTETNGLATAVVVAYNDSYQMEFWELNDNSIGKGVFENNKSIFDDGNPVKTFTKEVTTGNYGYYSFTGGDEFYLLARIDNTMLYCVADKEFKSEIADIAKTLGY